VLLEDKIAVIFGGGGSIGGAVARAFGREGARVFLAGRTKATLEKVAEQVRSAGGAAEAAEVDALDPKAVEEHAGAVAAEAGSLDISMNVITHPATHGTPLWEMEANDFMDSIEVALRSSFITMRAAARRMIEQRAGVILAFGGQGDRSGPIRDYKLGGTQVAFDGIETLRRQRGGGTARGPGHHPGERRCPRVAPRGLRRPPGDRRPDRGADPAGAGRDPRGCGKHGRLRRLRLGPDHDRGHRQPQLRRADRLS
jgi:NADP-dependent 3-hydroxy acid dehydrogenase YdfG